MVLKTHTFFLKNSMCERISLLLFKQEHVKKKVRTNRENRQANTQIKKMFVLHLKIREQKKLTK